ncbi:hypothetical protein QLL95_gp1038 [Cotonvirus japonicus]|uniref:Uncharacterized protein n=1 Tax=Cotonvirus japonicus TaxID=2811091 RepID=A0ABM7NSE1_9VIRU|nr:hypothetical protein QLL95_gp1038 [Cotonvirus japonicus]BCS83085.1 hypothetical protein [Cotonvirus japonicus]
MEEKLFDNQHSRKFWFYVRKGIFQVFLQLMLALMSVWDFAKQDNQENAYGKLYFYTSTILLIYTGMKYILEYIFTICSDEVVFKREILHKEKTRGLMESFNMLDSTDSSCGHYFVTIKRVFKLRYSRSKIFIKIDKLCWFLGLDSPILIPFNVIEKMGNIKDNLTTDNEDTYLHVTLTNLYTYNPNKYNTVVINVEDTDAQDSKDIESLIPKNIETESDTSIINTQFDLFGSKK